LDHHTSKNGEIQVHECDTTNIYTYILQVTKETPESISFDSNFPISAEVCIDGFPVLDTYYVT